MDPSPDGRLGNRRAALWWMGWHPLLTVVVFGVAGIALGNVFVVPLRQLIGVPVFTEEAAFALAGVAVGALLWHRGTGVVNRHHERVLDSFRSGVTPTGGDVSTFALLDGGAGSTPLVGPSASYDATFLAIDTDSVEVHDGTLALDERRRQLGDPRGTLPRKEIRTVSAEPSALVIETVNGDRFTFAADQAPTAVARALRDGPSGDRDQPAADDQEGEDPDSDARPADPSR